MAHMTRLATADCHRATCSFWNWRRGEKQIAWTIFASFISFKSSDV